MGVAGHSSADPQAPGGNRRMSRTVFCQLHQREVEGLDFVPWPGELGKRVYAGIGKPAWAQWLAYQTKLINENRLSPLDPKHRAFLEGDRKSTRLNSSH